MSNTDLIIEQRSRDIGDFLVGRYIPFSKKRMVGPFTFIDHMGPATVGPVTYMDVNQHPHIGLSTLTYLLEGEIMHADSIGTVQKIRPGSVNWMNAGSGVVHTERTPNKLRDGSPHTVNGYQIWVALPKDKEEMPPSFHHIDANELPQWHDKSASFKLIAGEGFGRTSPVPVHSPLFMVEIKTNEEYQLNIIDQLKGEIGIVVEKGAIQACDHHIEKGNMLISKTNNNCSLTIHANSHILLFGGEQLPEERFIDWNFVSHSKLKINDAIERWKNKAFPQVPYDTSYVPYPPKRF